MLRVYDKDNLPAFDVICLHSETAEDIQKSGVVHQIFPDVKVDVAGKMERIESMNEEMFDHGEVMREMKPLKERRLECMEEFKRFGGPERMLDESEESEQY